jgi:hypothetical protein
MPNRVLVIFAPLVSCRVARIGKEAAAMVCRLITFSVMSTQVLKSVVIQIVYQREMTRKLLLLFGIHILSRRRARRKYLEVVVKDSMCILRLENIKPKPLPNGNLTLYKLK